MFLLTSSENLEKNREHCWNKLSRATGFDIFRSKKLSRMTNFERFRGINLREKGKKSQNRKTFFPRKFLTLKYKEN